jgi:hypothetical protein
MKYVDKELKENLSKKINEIIDMHVALYFSLIIYLVRS